MQVWRREEPSVGRMAAVPVDRRSAGHGLVLPKARSGRGAGDAWRAGRRLGRLLAGSRKRRPARGRRRADRPAGAGSHRTRWATAIGAVGVVALAASLVVADTPSPPHIDAHAVAGGTWTRGDCSSVPLRIGGAHKRCLAAAGSAAFTFTVHNDEPSDVLLRECEVRAEDVDGRAIGPISFPPAFIYISDRDRPSRDPLLHPHLTRTFAWYVSGVSAPSITSFVAGCHGYFDPGPLPPSALRGT